VHYVAICRPMCVILHKENMILQHKSFYFVVRYDGQVVGFAIWRSWFDSLHQRNKLAHNVLEHGAPSHILWPNKPFISWGSIKW
jgi:hypothetical protein